MPRFMRTVCLEFFGTDITPAVAAIVEIKHHIDVEPGVALTGLEHLDERYVKAVNYSTKAARRERPKMVLMADIAGDDEDAVARAATHVVQLANRRDGEGFIAVSPEARARFWADRARTAAIATHTNAFKINEDVVIPLERLADYSRGIDRINIEQSTQNKLKMIGVDATDNVAVAQVRILINGQVAFTATDPPYELEYLAPMGVTTLTIAAEAVDSNGNTGTAQPVTITAIPDLLPTVAIVAPVDGGTAIRGGYLPITVTAADDLGVEEVDILVNDQTVFTAFPWESGGCPSVATKAAARAKAPVSRHTASTATSARPQGATHRKAATHQVGVADGTETPLVYQYQYLVPVDATTLTIGALAIDSSRQLGTAQPVTITAIPDPLTTAQGSVVDSNNAPVAGAHVICRGKSVASAADGGFSLANLSTVEGPIVCSAWATIGGVVQSASSGAVAAVAAGTTNVGTLVLSASSSRGRDFWLVNPAVDTCGCRSYWPSKIFIVSDTTANYTVSSAALDDGGTPTVTLGAHAGSSDPVISRSQKLVGAKGSRGAVGVTGATGAQGLVGATGPHGALGVAGPTGATGPQGLLVAAGPREAQGAVGSSGGTEPQGSITGTVTPDAPAEIDLPGFYTGGTKEVVENTGIHVTSDADVSVFLSFDVWNYETYLAIPTPSLGTEYFALGYGNDLSALAVVASQDSTHVTIHGCQSAFEATMDQGQTYTVQCNDVSGAHVVSDKPVAVVAAAPNGTWIPESTPETGYPSEMMLPVGGLWGTEVYSPPTTLGGASLYRVTAAADATVVTVDLGGGNVQTLQLNHGQFQELSFPNAGFGGVRFASNEPILVMQYGAGLEIENGYLPGYPFSMQLIPVTSFTQAARFYAFQIQDYWVRFTNYATIVAPNGAVGSVQLNGSNVDPSSFAPLPGGQYQYAQIPVLDGQNVVTAAQPIVVYTVGYAGYYDYYYSSVIGAYGAPTRF